MYQAGFIRVVIDGLAFINEIFLIPLSLILAVGFIYFGYPILGIFLYRLKKGSRNRNVEILFILASLLCAVILLFPIVKFQADIGFGNNKVEWKVFSGFLSSLVVYFAGIFVSSYKSKWAIKASWGLSLLGIFFSFFFAIWIFMFCMPHPPS